MALNMANFTNNANEIVRKTGNAGTLDTIDGDKLFSVDQKLLS